MCVFYFMEIWKDIVWYEWIYQISSMQKVKNIVKWNIMWLSLSSWYYKVVLSKEWNPRNIKIHRLLALHFIPNPLNLPCINHIDGNKLNNDLDNLEWCTYSENTRHAMTTWLQKFGYLKKQIFQYSVDGNLIRVWESSMQIQRETWWKNGNISRCCIWNRPTAYWYIWKHQKTRISAC